MSRRRRSLREMAGDPRFIPGIYNYCDRWCERCPLASRCLVYATEREQDAEEPASRDIHNRAFWTRLEEIFRETHEMLDELMREHGIVPDPADLEAARERERQRQDERNHPCAVAAGQYAKAVESWMGSASARLQERGETLTSHLRMGLPGADPEGDARRLVEATEIIRWYQHQIGVKIMRAASACQQEDETEYQLDHSDADGSAKVALIGMDRSLAAWSELLRQLPDDEDRILPLLAALGRLRKDVEAVFPGARAFIRPGFDTGDVPSA